MLGKLSYSVPAAGLVNIPGLALGAVTANSLAPSYFSNEAESVVSNTFWTTLATKYLAASGANNFSLKTLGSYRDVEVSGWSRLGRVFLRLDSSGKAIYFDHNGDTTNGTLEIGIATGVNETAYSGTSYPLYSNASLTTTVTGYVKAGDTTGHYFTFGVSGFDIYVKFNGVEFCRFKEYRHMNAGAVGLKSGLASGGYGWRGDNNGNLTITPLPTKRLYSSRYAANELDPRDFGLRSVTTTGDITSGTNSLKVAAANAFQVNDWVIVEIGTEPGAGLRGTVGVGGTWPSQSYANFASLPASAADLTYAWVRDTGQVYVYQASPAGWTTTQTEFIAGHGTLNNPVPFYYPTLAVPRSLHAKVSAIAADGKTLTLVKVDGTTAANASATATGANVYLDNQQPFNNLLQPSRSTSTALDSPRTIVVPAGTFVLGGVIAGSGHANWTIKGAGQTSTVFNSAKGMRPAGMALQQMSGLTVRDMAVNGNHGDNYYGLDFFDTLTPVPTSTQVSQYDAAGNIVWVQQTGGVSDTLFLVNWFPSGINLEQCDNSLAQNVIANDHFTNAVAFHDSVNSWVKNVTATKTAPTHIYTQWQIEHDVCTGGGCQDCTISSPHIVPGFEAFGSVGTAYINCVSNNALFSLNDAGSFSIQGGSITVTDTDWTQTGSASINNPLFAIDTSTGNAHGSLGGTITGLVITTGRITANNDVPVGINLTSQISNVTISGGSYTGPDWLSPSTLGGPVGIKCQGTNLTVDGFQCHGIPKSGDASIEIVSPGSGLIKNCIANNIIGGTGNTNNHNWSGASI